MAAPQTRDWAPRAPFHPPPAARERPPTEERYRTPYLVAVAWGTAWRYAIVGAVTLLIFAGLHPPLELVVLVGVPGLLAGLWFRRPWWAGAWRAAILGWGIGTASPHWFFPYVLVGALAAVTLEPWIVARGRPWHTGGRRAR